MWCGPNWRHCAQERTSPRNGYGAGGWHEPTRAPPQRERVPRPAIGLNACRIEDARVDPDLCQDPEIAADVIVPLRPSARPGSSSGPQDCRYDQLEVTPAYELDRVFGTRDRSQPCAAAGQGS